MLDIAKLKKNDFKALLQIVQTKMKLGIINDGCYEQKTWVKAEGGVSIFCDAGSQERVEHACGCTACIGGWMALEAGCRTGHEISRFTTRAERVADMSDLFSGVPLLDRRTGFAKTPTVRQARKAIENYFDGAEDPWKGVGRA